MEEENEQLNDTNESITDSKKQNLISLSKYIKLNYINSGSFGEVYTIKEKETGKIFAAKISFTKLNEASEDMIVNLSREINILCKLNHPSVLKLIYFSPYDFENNPHPVIITEYANNGSLNDLLFKSNILLDETQKLIIIYGIASALLYLHSHGIIHRDLKPDNILLNSFLFPKIADFGLSKKIDNLNNESCAFQSIDKYYKGTPMYMAPEIWNNYEYSEASDVYAFALIVYEIMTNKKPFDNMSFYKIMSKISIGYRPQFVQPISESYKKLIEICWSNVPSKRPSFSIICQNLESNKDFITEKVNKDAFLNYVRYLNNYISSFNSNKESFQQIQILNKAYFDFGIKLFPYKDYLKLNENCQNLINQAENNPEKQFIIGKSLIEGLSEFTQNTQLGIEYLQISYNNGYFNSLVYYCRMLIKGDVIHQNFEEAKKLLNTKFKDHENEFYLLLYGKIMKKERKFVEAANFFKKSMLLKNGEAIYEYGKIISKIDKVKLITIYYKKAILYGCSKAMFKYGMLLLKRNTQNKEEGVQYIKMAADKGYPPSLFEYTEILRKRDDFSPANGEYLKYLKNAAESGDINSMHQYGLVLSHDKNSHSIDKAIFYFKKASDKGHIESMYEYGLLIYKENKIRDPKTNAIECLNIASKSGNKDAKFFYNILLSLGDGIKINKRKGYFGLIKSLDNNDSVESSPWYFFDSRGVLVNKEKMMNYYQMAIKNGHLKTIDNYSFLLKEKSSKNESTKYFKIEASVAQQATHIIICYFEKIDLTQSNINKQTQKLLKREIQNDAEESIKYLQTEIFKGCSEAMYKYAMILYKGNGIPANKEKAMYYLKLAIKMDNIDAILFLAYAYYNGDGVVSDKKEAYKYFEMASRKHSAEALYKCANMLDIGDGVPKDKYHALFLYKRAIASGNFDGIDNFISLLIKYKTYDFLSPYEPLIQYTIHIKSDSESLKYFKIAANKGNIDAMLYCGLLLYKNYDFDSDSSYDFSEEEDEEELNELATEYFKIAADKGNADAMCCYAITLYNNDDLNESIKYLKMAIEKNNTIAMNNYACLIYDNDKEEAIKYFMMAIEKGNSVAAANYAYIINDIDKKESLKYYKIAADQGFLFAIFVYANELYDEEENKEEAFQYFKKYLDEKAKNEDFYYNYLNKYKKIKENYSIILFSEYDEEDNIKTYFMQEADSGNIRGMFYYAYSIENDDEKESLKYYKMAADGGDSDSMYKYAFKLVNDSNNLNPLYKEEAFKYAKMGMEKRNIDAMGLYASMLLNGEGTEVDKDEAVKYLKISADHGNSKSMYYLALILYNEGSNKDEAYKYFKTSVDSGNDDGALYLFEILKNNPNIMISQKEKNKYVKIAANKALKYKYETKKKNLQKLESINLKKIAGEALYQYSMNLKNSGTPTGDIYYIGYLEEAGKLENYEAMYKLGLYYSNKEKLHEYDIKEAITLFTKLSEPRYSDSIYQLALLLLKQSSNRTKYEYINDANHQREAQRYYNEMKKNDNLDALYKYAIILNYFKDLNNFDRDYINESIKYFKIAADNGNLDAMNCYAFLLNNNYKYESDKEEAFTYFKKAAEKGNANAMNNYAYMMFTGDGVMTDKGKALKYFKMAADKGNSDAMFNYGYLRYKGKGISISKTEAYNYIKKAVYEKNVFASRFCISEVTYNQDMLDFFYLSFDTINVRNENKVNCSYIIENTSIQNLPMNVLLDYYLKSINQ